MAAQRDNVVSQLTRLLDSDATLTSSALKQNNLSLLREKLAAHKRDLVRLKSNLSDARNRVNLLSNVRDDIQSYRDQNPADAEAEYMLDERRHIDNSNSMADSVLSQAYAVQESFTLQRETLSNINRRITLAASPSARDQYADRADISAEAKRWHYYGELYRILLSRVLLLPVMGSRNFGCWWRLARAAP